MNDKLEKVIETVKPPSISQNTLISSTVSWATGIKSSVRAGYWSSLSIDVFKATGYEKLTSDIVNRMKEMSFAERFKVEPRYVNSVEECSNDLILFPKYCGNARFESKEAKQLVEAGKKLVFLVYRYGSTSEQMLLGELYDKKDKKCGKFEFFINNLTDRQMVAGEKTQESVEQLTTHVINNSETKPAEK